MTWAWMALGLTVQWFVGLAFPKRIGKGLLTKPMWRWPVFGSARPTMVRSKQIFVLLALFYALVFGTALSDLYVTAGLWVLIIALYIDDYLFGDDEGKRRWDWVRNKVKWRMKLLQPAKAHPKDTA